MPLQRSRTCYDARAPSEIKFELVVMNWFVFTKATHDNCEV